MVRGSKVSLGLCVAVAMTGVFGCAKPGPVRTKAMKASNTDQSNDPGMAGLELEETNQRTGVKYKK